jgi:hypothetical protein
MAEALARLSGADQATEIELIAHTRQHLEWKVQQGGRARRGCGHGGPLVRADFELLARARQHLEWKVRSSRAAALGEDAFLEQFTDLLSCECSKIDSSQGARF